MKTNRAIKHYGSVEALAEALGITTNAIYQWPDDVPWARALELERLTDGELKAGKRPTRNNHPWRSPPLKQSV